MDTLVVGAGVIGLSVAVRLLERGHRVRIWSADPPAATTSAVAAAIWYPYRVAPAGAAIAWGRRSLTVFESLAGVPATGVTLRAGVELLREPAAAPWWRDAVAAFRHAEAAELPAGYAAGYALRLPVVAMPGYLDWLQHRAVAGGASLEYRRVGGLGEALRACTTVVNCSGLGARDLARDPTVTPVRGQVVVVRNPGVERFWIDEGHPDGVTYVIPRGGDCVLGGTAEAGRWTTVADPDTTSAIVRRCAALEPRLAGAEILSVGVGLRPARPTVRLEVEQARGGRRIVHCYGHGGAGVTLSWGCADAVMALVESPLAG